MNQTLCTLVTGASSGMGRETAVRLSASHRLLLHGRDSRRLEETRLLCTRPDDHCVWQVDLQDIQNIETTFVQVLASCNISINNFVHCAGALSIRPVRLLKHDLVLNSFKVNFFSAVEISRLLTSKKINCGALRGIVFISSTASKFGARGFSAYSATKGALDAYMRGLAVELAPTVRVNSVLPGAIQTSMTEQIFENTELIEKMAKEYPLGLGQQSDIAQAVEFLLSDTARWITGQQLTVDGGRTINISG